MSFLSKLFQQKVSTPVVTPVNSTNNELAAQQEINNRLRGELTILENKLSDVKTETQFNMVELSKRNKLVEYLTRQALSEIGIPRNYSHE
jgi:hypothetical protein